MRSRISRTIHFPDYSIEELLQIIERLALADAWRLDPPARVALRARLARADANQLSGNGRHARNLLDAVVRAHARRMQGTVDVSSADLTTLRRQDVLAAREPST